MNREKIGSFWVDTGTVLIGDPCQFLAGEGEPPRITYDSLSRLWHEQGETVPSLDDREKEVFAKLPPSPERDDLLAATRVIRPDFIRVDAPSGQPGGFVITVGNDGWYPVYLERDKYGEPKRIVIELGGYVKP